MRNYARIANGIAVEIFDLDAHHPDATGIDGLFHSSMTWVPCANDARVGDVLVGGVVVSQNHYQVLRAAAYPDPRNKDDAQVKMASADPVIQAEGLAQMNDYVNECLAVKLKYPKPVI